MPKDYGASNEILYGTPFIIIGRYVETPPAEPARVSGWLLLAITSWLLAVAVALAPMTMQSVNVGAAELDPMAIEYAPRSVMPALNPMATLSLPWLVWPARDPTATHSSDWLLSPANCPTATARGPCELFAAWYPIATELPS